jgi:hypothetical protein
MGSHLLSPIGWNSECRWQQGLNTTLLACADRGGFLFGVGYREVLAALRADILAVAWCVAAVTSVHGALPPHHPTCSSKQQASRASYLILVIHWAPLVLWRPECLRLLWSKLSLCLRPPGHATPILSMCGHRNCLACVAHGRFCFY